MLPFRNKMGLGVVQKKNLIPAAFGALFCSEYPPIQCELHSMGEPFLLVIGFQLGFGSDMSHFEPEWSRTIMLHAQS